VTISSRADERKKARGKAGKTQAELENAGVQFTQRIERFQSRDCDESAVVPHHSRESGPQTYIVRNARERDSFRIKGPKKIMHHGRHHEVSAMNAFPSSRNLKKPHGS
jgi:hypothetical protein